MDIIFQVFSPSDQKTPPTSNSVHLIASNWDDYSFKTTFELIYCNSDGLSFSLGTVKIGYKNQSYGWSLENLNKTFTNLSDDWFSLGQDADYYAKAYTKLEPDIREKIFRILGDVVANDEILRSVKEESVFRNSLLRGVSFSAIYGQFRRILNGLVILSEFSFGFRDHGNDQHAAIDLKFRVRPASKPSTNIHVLIGRNGVGKTTLLNNMVSALLPHDDSDAGRCEFYLIDEWSESRPLPTDYFSSVISVSFSAFDPFTPPADQPDRSLGIAYFYLGMKKARSGVKELASEPPKNDKDLANDFINSLAFCLSQSEKRNRWLSSIKRLESDRNFANMNFGRLLEMEIKDALVEARKLVDHLSSGHAIVLLTITKLVETVEEKSLVLLDEPECHLHPPLLSAFIRALSDLLSNRNGVAIIATHSPVVVQEVPRLCVWKLSRLNLESRSDRPERETFGENVGVLTREIFGLEVSKSGFHDMLYQAVQEGGSFESIMEEYKEQLGVEAQAILRSLLVEQSEKNQE